MMGRLAGVLPSRTPSPRSTAKNANTQLSLTCRGRVRQSSAPTNIASMRRGWTLSAPLFCSFNVIDRACVRYSRSGTQVRALVR